MGSHLRGVEIFGAILFLSSISVLTIAVPTDLHTNKCLQLGLEAHQKNQPRETKRSLSQGNFISEIVEICRFIEKISRERGLDCPFASLALQEYDLFLKKLPPLNNYPFKQQQEESFNVSTQATVLQTPSDVFPETQYDYPLAALTFSGGGNRALVAENGQLRAFNTLSLMSKIGYQSAVSGGTWGASIYQFYQQGADNDTQLLGPPTPSLSSLDLETLAQPAPPLANTATTNMLLKALELLVDHRSSLRHLWANSVGETYLEPFGANADTFFTLSTQTEQEIKAKNPSLQDQPFLTPQLSLPPRPFFIASSVCIGPIWATSSSSVVSLQMTPLYAGSPYIPDNKEQPYPLKGDPSTHKSLYVGGGVVDAYAFGSTSPETLKGEKGGEVANVVVEHPFGLRQVAGFSSDDSEWSQNNETKQQEFLGTAVYWPILPPDAKILQASEPYVIGDGGSIDYLGFLAIVQRNIPTIAVYINTEVPLPNKTTYDACTATSPPSQEVFLSEGLAPLFGIQIISPVDGYFLHNQIFNQSSFYPVMCDLQTDKEEGRAAVSYRNYTTIENSWWGIPAGRNLSVAWFYLDYAQDFVSSLPPDTQQQIALGDEGMFPHFPQYQTLDENGPLSFTTYTTSQVNLLAAYAEWAVMEEEENLKKFFN